MLVDHRDEPVGGTVVFDKVLMLRGDSSIQVGKPHIDGACVTCEVVAEEKGKKIRVGKFKKRKGYKKIIGHRQQYTRIQVQSIAGTA